MIKKFSSYEQLILNKFNQQKKFYFEDQSYNIVCVDKPTCSKGEPKTDVYVKCQNCETGKIRELKISVKMENADFLANKISAKRAEQIFGDNWKEIVYNSIKKLESKFYKRKLIYKKRAWPTRKGSITLGWKFELVNTDSGQLASSIEVSKDELIDIYAGNTLSRDKKDSFILGKRVENSGVANYILEYTPSTNSTLEDIVSKLLPIKEYIKTHPNIYFACKALNYRTFKDKYDGNRPLAVFVDWCVENDKLAPDLIFTEPLTIRGNKVANKLKNSLKKLGINTTDDITEDIVTSPKIIHNPTN